MERSQRTPRRSNRLQTKEKKSVEKIERMRKRRRPVAKRVKAGTTDEDSSEPDGSSEDSSSSEAEFITPVKRIKAKNDFTKVYNTYNMDKGLDCYEADFIDDSEEYVCKKQQPSTTPLLPKGRKKRRSVAIMDSDDESDGNTQEMPVTTPTSRKSSRRQRIESSSSSEGEQRVLRRGKRKLLKMDSDDELEENLARKKSSRAEFVRQKREKHRGKLLQELREARSSKNKDEEQRVSPLYKSSSDEREDHLEEDDSESNWIVPDEECSLSGWELAADISLYNNVLTKMSLKSLQSHDWNEEDECHQLILAAGGRGSMDILESVSTNVLTEIIMTLDDFDTTLLHVVLALPWLQDSFSKSETSSTCQAEIEKDKIAELRLTALYEFDKKWFCHLLQEGSRMRPNIVELAIWYRQEKCLLFLIQIYETINVNWKESITDGLYATQTVWPSNYLQCALLSHVLNDDESTSSAAGIVSIIFPYMEESDISAKDVQGYTAVMYAAQLGDWETLAIFLRNECVSFDNVKDIEGRSLLHLAAASGNVLCVHQLLECGHVVDCRDNNGWPPLLYAHFSGHEDCFLVLMEAEPHQLSVLSDLLHCKDDENRKKSAKVVRELLISLAHSESYYSLFNRFVSNNLCILDDESFGFMKHCMSLVSFENKQAWLKRKLELLRKLSDRRRNDSEGVDLYEQDFEEFYRSDDEDSEDFSEIDSEEFQYDRNRIVLNDLPRSGLLQEVLQLLKEVTTVQYWEGPPDVTFRNEPGICTGPRKEFWTCLSHELANGQGHIFTQCDDSQLSLQPYQIFTRQLPNTLIIQHKNISSMRTPPTPIADHLCSISTVGSLFATAVMYNDTLDCNLSMPLVKELLGQSVSNDDLESAKGDLYHQLMNLKQDTVDGLELTFSTMLICPWNDKPVDIELIEGGADKPVTDENKVEYIQCLSRFILKESVQQETRAFKKGFWKVIPKKYISAFTPNELSLLLSGVPHIDVQNWKMNTNYRNFSSSHHVAIWFWKLVEDLSEQEKGLLLKFSTGSPRLPPGGFACLQGLGNSVGFTLSLGQGLNKIPHAQTCFNLLVLSDYSTEQELRNKGLIAIRYGCEGFEFS